ncbi:hypothetical protein TWF694_005148 [Orbilia ellipsospora]|uniref:Uncharacterized protein n=1 Tax=Orbilia ellipsospora TaxID=2528407 RepID=A0AAV9WUP9_9PEZI
MYKYQAYERDHHQHGRDIPPDVLADMFHNVAGQLSKNNTRQRAPPPEHNTHQSRRPVAYDTVRPPIPQEKSRIPKTYRFPPEPEKQFVRFVIPSVEHTVEYSQLPRGKHSSNYQRVQPPPKHPSNFQRVPPPLPKRSSHLSRKPVAQHETPHFQRAPVPPRGPPPPPSKPQRLRAQYVEPAKEPEPPLLQFHISRWDRFVHRIREFIEGE